MQFHSTMQLLKADPKSKAYFDALPENIRQQLLDEYTGARCLDELRVYADDLMTVF